MSCISWNYQGLGNPWTVRALHNLVKTKCPQILFLVETKQDVTVVDSVWRKLGFQSCFNVPRCGYGGGLALLWDASMEVVVKSFSQNHVHAIIEGDVSGCSWRFTSFYGHLEVHKRRESWELLKLLSNQNNLPWLCCEDFNEIVRGLEKIGGSPFLEWQMW